MAWTWPTGSSRNATLQPRRIRLVWASVPLAANYFAWSSQSPGASRHTSHCSTVGRASNSLRQASPYALVLSRKLLPRPYPKVSGHIKRSFAPADSLRASASLQQASPKSPVPSRKSVPRAYPKASGQSRRNSVASVAALSAAGLAPTVPRFGGVVSAPRAPARLPRKRIPKTIDT